MTDNVYSELYKRLQKMGDGYVMREKYLIKQSENELENLLEDMYISVPYPDYSHNSLFNFEPNHSIAGDRFPCSSIDCRLKRINELSIFSSMYADHVNIDFPLNRHINALIDNQQIDREMLLDDLEVIAAYRPLAEAGIVQFQPNMAVCCNQCMKKIDYFRELFMNQYDKFLANKELDLLRRLDCHVALDEYGIPYVAVGPMLEYGIDEEIDLNTHTDFRYSFTGSSHLGVYGPCVFIRCVIEKAKKTARLGSESSAFDGRVLLGLDRLGLNPVSQCRVTSGSRAGVWLIGCDPTDETARYCSECGAAGRVRSSWRRRYSHESRRDTVQRRPLPDISAVQDPGRCQVDLLLDARPPRDRTGRPS